MLIDSVNNEKQLHYIDSGNNTPRKERKVLLLS